MSALLLGVLFSVALVGLRLAHERALWLVRLGRTRPQRTPVDVGISHWCELSFESEDGLTLLGWYVEPILVHGLGSNRGQLLEDAALLVESGYGVLTFDLRNSGDSGGA